MKRWPLTKAQAVGEIAVVCRVDRTLTKGEFQRLVRAFELLGLTLSEMDEACRQLGFAGNDGSLRHKALEKLAPWRVAS
jgi:hypothetical protein